MRKVLVVGGIVAAAAGFLVWQHQKNEKPSPPYNTLVADFRYINNDITNPQSGTIQLEADCQHLLTDTQNADTFDATPSVLDDPTAGRQWSDFVSNTEAGAGDCVNGIKNSDEQQYLRASGELNTGLVPLLKLQRSHG